MYPIKKLSEITSLVTKWSTPTTYGYSFLSEWINFIKIENISNGKINKSSLSAFISEEAHLSQKRSILEDWDFLISIAWTIGSIALVTKDILPANTNQALAIIRGYQNFVNKDFLRYIFLSSLSNWFKNKARGGALQNISLEDIKNIEIPLPPLSTQSRIVARLDSAFASIDEQISLLRANIVDVENIRKSVLEESFQSGEYEIKTLWEICEFMGSGFACNKKNEVSNGYIHLRTHNIWTDWKLNFDHFVTINPDMIDMNKAKIFKWDIIFNNTNSKELVWKTAYVEQDYEYGFSNHLTRMVIKNSYYSKYVSIYINYLFGKWFFQNLANKWIWQAGVNNGMLKEIQIPLPPLPRQHEIVAHLDRVFAETTALRGEYEAQIWDLETLKQSLLEEAFAGRLVTD